MLLDAETLRRKFDQGLSFEALLAASEPVGHRPQWDERHGRLALDPAQAALAGSFTRDMNVLCLTGTWCGDCALQGASLARIAEANPDKVHLRFLPKSEDHADLIMRAPINAGFRVPVTWFMAEDFEPLHFFGDRTLSRYRSMARKQLPPGQANVIAPPPADPVREVLHEMLDMFERAQLMLRLSARLRTRHGD
jgi:hypothetical protein